MAQGVYVSAHPLVQHKLTLLRNQVTEPQTFRHLVREMSQLLFYEATLDLKLSPVTVRTPLADCPGQELAEAVGLFPILRAGLGMAEAIYELMPRIHVYHLGLYRDHETLKPVWYYQKLPARPHLDLAVMVDPMLATGGSAVAAIDMLKQWGLRRIKYLGLIAAPEGIEALRQAHPDVALHLAAVDTHLNEQAYIVPGLGDAGDRQFGTG